MILGNKCDLNERRQVSRDRAFAVSFSSKFYSKVYLNQGLDSPELPYNNSGLMFLWLFCRICTGLPLQSMQDFCASLKLEVYKSYFLEKRLLLNCLSFDPSWTSAKLTYIGPFLLIHISHYHHYPLLCMSALQQSIKTLIRLWCWANCYRVESLDTKFILAALN